MKEKRTYKRFELIPFLALLGCAGMLVFESVFVLELYDRAVKQPELPAPVIETLKPAEAPVVPAAPADVPPAQIEPVPAAAPVG